MRLHPVLSEGDKLHSASRSMVVRLIRFAGLDLIRTITSAAEREAATLGGAIWGSLCAAVFALGWLANLDGARQFAGIGFAFFVLGMWTLLAYRIVRVGSYGQVHLTPGLGNRLRQLVLSGTTVMALAIAACLAVCDLWSPGVVATGGLCVLVCAVAAHMGRWWRWGSSLAAGLLYLTSVIVSALGEMAGILNQGSSGYAWIYPAACALALGLLWSGVGRRDTRSGVRTSSSAFVLRGMPAVSASARSRTIPLAARWLDGTRANRVRLAQLPGLIPILMSFGAGWLSRCETDTLRFGTSAFTLGLMGLLVPLLRVGMPDAAQTTAAVERGLVSLMPHAPLLRDINRVLAWRLLKARCIDMALVGAAGVVVTYAFVCTARCGRPADLLEMAQVWALPVLLLPFSAAVVQWHPRLHQLRESGARMGTELGLVGGLWAASSCRAGAGLTRGGTHAGQRRRSSLRWPCGGGMC